MLVACAVPIKAPQQIKNLVKSDTAFFVEAVRDELDKSMALLLVKLYGRNPVQLPGGTSVDGRIEQLKATRINVSEFDSSKPNQLVRLAFKSDFDGDRVFAFVSGLQSMINNAFDHRREFLLLDDLPTAQFVYNSARNIEISAYLLRTQRTSTAKPYLFADGIQNGVLNASYSQLMGEMIGLQDALSVALAKKDQRALNRVARGVASFVFLPVGF